MTATAAMATKVPAALFAAMTLLGAPRGGLAAEAPPAEPVEEAMSAQTVAGWVVTAVAGAAFISATVTGALALQQHQQLAGQCPERTCEPALHAEVDQFNAFRFAATTSIIGAGVCGVTGISLLLSAPPGNGGGPDESPRAGEATARGLWLRGCF